MAEKRMFTKKITDDDNFISLPSSTQALYFHLNQGADDDGFNNQVQMAMWKSHATIDDLKVLMAKSYIIRFESGVIVIKHWRMHNTLRKDRYTPTSFQEELKLLGIKDNGAYTLDTDGCQAVADWLPDGCHSIVENSIEKCSKEKSSKKDSPKRFVPPYLAEVQAYCIERGNGIDAQAFIDFYASKGWLVGKTKMSDWKAAVRTWESRNRKQAKQTYADTDYGNPEDIF